VLKLKPFLSSDDLATLIDVHPVTLAKWRAKGEGPGYLKVCGRIRYPREDVLGWFEQSRGHSTAVEQEPAA